MEKTYKVFVSSTFLDNQERRKIVQDAVTRAGMLWHGMEIFPATNNSAVEESMKHVKEADLLVGIIAHRYGWEPDRKISITEMEYNAAKERLMFRLDPDLPVNKDKDFDSGTKKWKKQEKLEKFVKRISDKQAMVLFGETSLGTEVFHSLIEWRKRKEGKKTTRSSRTSRPTRSPKPKKDFIPYRQKAETLHATLPVAGFVTQLKVPIDIEEIYIPLRAMVDLRGVDEEEKGFADSRDAEKKLGTHGMEISLPDIFEKMEERKRKGVVVLGDPGSGKTTHLKRIFLWCLRNGPETIGLPEGMLPLFLPLRELEKTEKSLEAFIRGRLSDPTLQIPKNGADKILKRGNLLLLLDGLDEVPELSARTKVSGWIKRAVKTMPGCRFVVSCRFAGYDPGVRLNEDFLETHVRPLTEKQAGEFVHNWYGIVEKGLARDPEQAGEIARKKAGNLVERLKEPDFRARRVFELTRNPLLLTNICLVHRHRGALPHKRARLYEECIDVLLEHWRGSKGLKVVSAQSSRRALQPAALWLHGEEGRTRASAGELAPHIEPVLKSVDWKGESSKDFLKAIRDDSGLLTGWDQERYGFMHLGFQEYLTAREIRRRAFKEPELLKGLASHFGESWWQEVALLMLALEDPSLFEDYMREVVKIPAFTKHPDLVQMCLDDAAETSPVPFLELLKKNPGKGKGLWERQLAALRILARLDPAAAENLQSVLSKHPFPEITRWFRERFGPALAETVKSDRGGYELIKILGGTFMMGSRESEAGRYDDEGPVHEVAVKDFFLGRYPVTNEEYSFFLGEYPDTPEPEYWADRKFNQPKQPVVGVDWNDAKRYAEWAGLRLPTEAEWEYACRAGKKSRYYLGNSKKDLDRAGWYLDNSGSKLHPVGEKEPNEFGLYDMHGNIWEWVEDDWHEKYSGAPDDGSSWVDDPRGSVRVFRGGSWNDSAGGCRSAYRVCGDPGIRWSYRGFRLSRSCFP